MFSFTRYRKTSCIESDTSEDERSEDNNYDRHEIGLDDSGSGSNYDDLGEDESEEELKQYTMKQLKVKLAARGLFLGGNKPDLIQRLLNPQPSDFKYKTDENDDDDDDDARIGFDDPVETNTPVETAESESEEVLNECTVKQLKIKLLERGLLVSGTKPQLIQRLLDPQPSDYKNKMKVEPWKTSKAKALLTRLLRENSSRIQGRTPEEVWESSKWFKDYPKANFVTNMINLQKALDARGEIVARDNDVIEAELDAMRELYPRSSPLWCEHKASQLLEQDVKACLHKGLSPTEFQQTRPEYMEWELNIFRKHIYQEERKWREMPMKVAKRNKLAEAKHKEEVDEEMARWHADQENNYDVNEMAGLMID